jgi:hypothetical protein
MPILACLVAYESTILLQHSPYTSQFLPLATTILPKLKPGVMTYVYDRFYFHYISGLSKSPQKGFIFLCMTGEETLGAVEFLQLLQQQFTHFLETKKTESTPLIRESVWNVRDLLQLSSEFEPQLQELFRTKATSASQTLHNELSSLQSIMTRNVDLVLARGEQLDSIMERTQDLVDSSQAFRRSSRQLGYQMWWKNRKITIVGGVCLVLVIGLTLFFLL